MRTLFMHLPIYFLILSIQQPVCSDEANTSPSEETIERTGIEARLYPEQRDEKVLQLVQWLSTMDHEEIKQYQRGFQEAFLWVCDPEIFDTLSPSTIDAADDAMESVFTLPDLLQGSRWDPLAYVHGFFNRDVTVDDIIRIGKGWEEKSPEERAPLYPTYIHLIDAVCKPLSMGPLQNEKDTAPALEAALPVLKKMLAQPPGHGTAFHEPTHSALVLAAMYNRWENHGTYGPILKKHLGSREAFIQLFEDHLIGSIDDPSKLQDFELRFYGYTGRFLANALARLNAREAAGTLRKTLDIYETLQVPDASKHYTKRALAALGEEKERKLLEAGLQKENTRKAAVTTLVWLSRNGLGETKTYANTLLARELNTVPGQALPVWLKNQITD